MPYGEALRKYGVNLRVAPLRWAFRTPGRLGAELGRCRECQCSPSTPTKACPFVRTPRPEERGDAEG